MNFEYIMAGDLYRVSITKKDDSFLVTINDQEAIYKLDRMIDNKLFLESSDKKYTIILAKNESTNFVNVNFQDFIITDSTEKRSVSYNKEHLLDESSDIASPMPGKILKIMVEVGQQISTRDNLIILEAMKMENNIVSPKDGIVKKINFKEGDLVEAGQILLEIE